MAAYSITAEELMAKTIAASKAKGIELGQPLSDEVAASVATFLDFMESESGSIRLELPTSQAETDEKLGKIKDMPTEEFEGMAKMCKGMESPAAEEIMVQAIAVVKAMGIELDLPLSDEVAPVFLSFLTGMPPGKIMPPEDLNQAMMDGMFEEMKGAWFEGMSKEMFEELREKAAQRVGKGDKAFSITAKELVTQTAAKEAGKGE